MSGRVFGWVQDPGNLRKLRDVVELFDAGSATHARIRDVKIPSLVEERDGQTRFMEAMAKRPLVLNYQDLVGSVFTPRSSARCNGIIQATIPGQKRPFIADWPADNFLRWAVSLGFVDRRGNDDFIISRHGLALSASPEKSEKEYAIYERALLSYPPAARVVDLLAKAEGEPLTKFEIGRQLGFVGEQGFTSIGQDLFVKMLATCAKEERKEIKQNWEGASDKYARMICSWLAQLKHPWVEGAEKTISVKLAGKKYSEKLAAFAITKKGYTIRKKISGTSRFAKAPKRVFFEMLATKGADREYLRKRRARIILLTCKKRMSIAALQKELAKNKIEDSAEAIKADIRDLQNIGLQMQTSRAGVYCSEKIVGLKLPADPIKGKSKALVLIEKCRRQISHIPRDYLALIAMGFDRNDSRMFEIKTVELLTEHCKFEGAHLGGGNRPDGIVYTPKYGVILDAKSYAAGFNIPIAERDKMKRYVEENKNRNPAHNKTRWWEGFPPNIRNFCFLFVSGEFGGGFKKQLEILGQQTKTPGAVASAFALLLLADQIAGKRLSLAEFNKKISVLDEVAA